MYALTFIFCRDMYRWYFVDAVKARVLLKSVNYKQFSEINKIFTMLNARNLDGFKSVESCFRERDKFKQLRKKNS